MKQAGWPRAPMLIGFVLSLVTERYLHLSMSRYGLDWLLFPSVLAILALIVIARVAGLPSNRLHRKPHDEATLRSDPYILGNGAAKASHERVFACLARPV